MGLASRANLIHPLNQIPTSGTDTPSAVGKQTTGAILKGKGVKDNLSKQVKNHKFVSFLLKFINIDNFIKRQVM